MWVDRAVDTFLKYCNPKAKFIPFRFAYWAVWFAIITIFAWPVMAKYLFGDEDE